MLPCYSKGFVVYFGSILRCHQLIFAEKGVTLPSKNGVVVKATEDSVA